MPFSSYNPPHYSTISKCKEIVKEKAESLNKRKKKKMSTNVEPCGDLKNGKAFDDGAYDGVSKVIVGEHPTHGVAYLKIQYMKDKDKKKRKNNKDGNLVEKQHGSIRGQQITESVFALDYPNEYITRIRGRFITYVNHTVLKFRIMTSRGRSSEEFGTHSTERVAMDTEDIDLSADGTELVGLHGRSGDVIYSLGARFATVSSVHKPSYLKGGSYGVPWDDGVYNEGVSKLWVGEGDGHLSYIKFEYCNGDVWVPSTSQPGDFDKIKKLIPHSHGEDPQEEPKEFAMLHVDEYITSIEGTYNDDVSPTERALTSLKFKTSQNRESMMFGKAVGAKFIIKGEGVYTKLVGFMGKSNLNRLFALGAHFTVAPPRRFAVVKGGDTGNGIDWDDGIHGRVRLIKAASRWPSILAIDFQYVDDGYEYRIICGGFGQVMEKGDTYAVPVSPPVFAHSYELYADEYVTSVEVGMLKNYDHNTLSIAMLIMKTNRGRALKFGRDPIAPGSSVTYAKKFILQERGHKIVGFFGRSSEFLEELGVHLEPINDE